MADEEKKYLGFMNKKLWRFFFIYTTIMIILVSVVVVMIVIENKDMLIRPPRCFIYWHENDTTQEVECYSTLYNETKEKENVTIYYGSNVSLAFSSSSSSDSSSSS